MSRRTTGRVDPFFSFDQVMSILSFFTSMTEPLHCEEEVGTEEGVVAVEEAVAVEEEEEEEPEDVRPPFGGELS